MKRVIMKLLGSESARCGVQRKQKDRHFLCACVRKRTTERTKRTKGQALQYERTGTFVHVRFHADTFRAFAVFCSVRDTTQATLQRTSRCRGPNQGGFRWIRRRPKTNVHYVGVLGRNACDRTVRQVQVQVRAALMCSLLTGRNSRRAGEILHPATAASSG